MRKILSLFVFILFCLVLSDGLSAYSFRRKNDFMKPQAGLWFGPSAPLFGLKDRVDPALGGGVFVRLNTPLELFKVGGEFGYQKYVSTAEDKLSVLPLYGNILFLLPIPFPMNFQLKAGAGTARVAIYPDNRSQFEPLFMAGLEASFMAGRLINFGIRMDYMMLYEKNLKGAKHNGHIFNAGLTLYFNL